MSNKISKSDLLETIPLVCSHDVVAFPHRVCSLFVEDESFVCSLEEAQSGSGKICLAYRDYLREDDSEDLKYHRTGTVCSIINTKKLADGRTKVLVLGLYRASIVKITPKTNFLQVNLVAFLDISLNYQLDDFSPIKERITSYLEHLNRSGKVFAPELLLLCEDIEDPGKLSDLISSFLGLSMYDSQKLLAINDPIVRLNIIYDFLSKYSLQDPSVDKVSTTPADVMSQINSIRSNLASENDNSDIEDLWKRLALLKIPKDSLQEISRQLSRLEKMNAETSEAVMTRTYIETVLSSKNE